MNKSSKKIILIALHDAGVATAIMGAFSKLSEKYELHVFAKDKMAYSILKKGFSEEEMKKFRICSYDSLNVIEARQVLNDFKPVAVIVGISNTQKEYVGQEGMSHKGDLSFCEAANNANIPTIGIIEATTMSKSLFEKRLNNGRTSPKGLIVQSVGLKKKCMEFGHLKDRDIFVSTMPKYAKFSEIAKDSNKGKIRDSLLKKNKIGKDDFVAIYSSSATPAEDIPAIKFLAESIKDRKDVKVLFSLHPKDRQNIKFMEELNTIIPSAKIADYEDVEGVRAASFLASGSKGLFLGVKTSMILDVALTKANTANINLQNNPEYVKNFAGLARNIVGEKPNEIGNLVDEIKTKGGIVNPEAIKSYDKTDTIDKFCFVFDEIVNEKIKNSKSFEVLKAMRKINLIK